MTQWVYGTWVDVQGVRHYASGIKRDEGFFDRRRGAWDTKVLCGDYINVKPRKPRAVITCFRCLWQADYMIDKAQDTDLKEIGLFGLFNLPTPPKAT